MRTLPIFFEEDKAIDRFCDGSTNPDVTANKLVTLTGQRKLNLFLCSLNLAMFFLFDSIYLRTLLHPGIFVQNFSQISEFGHNFLVIFTVTSTTLGLECKILLVFLLI